MADQQTQQTQQPQVITLDSKNSVEILASYIEVSQKAGTFALPESDILKRCRDLLLKGIEDSEINIPTAKNLFVQAIQKGQSKGCFSLDDAYILHRVCTYISQNVDAPTDIQPTQITQPTQIDDLSTLSDPVPLKSSGPRII